MVGMPLRIVVPKFAWRSLRENVVQKGYWIVAYLISISHDGRVLKNRWYNRLATSKKRPWYI